MKRMCLLLPVAGLMLGASSFVLADQNVLFTAKLSTKAVTHPLFQPGNPKAPRPFYRKFCAQVKSESYKNAKGYATLWYNSKTKVLQFAYTYTGLSGPAIMMHFHIGKKGKGGPIVQTICGHPPPGNPQLGYSKPAISSHCPLQTTGFIQGRYKLTGNQKLTPSMSAQQEEADLMAGKLYINVHTCLNEQGEIRGQIKPMK